MSIKKINRRLAISAVSVAVVVGILYMAYLDHNAFKETIVLQTQEQLLEITKTTARRVEEYISTRSKELKIIASNPIFQEEVYKKVMHSKPDCEFCPIRTLSEINEDDADALTVIDRNGIMLHRHPFIEDRPGMDHTDKPGVAYVLREHKPYVSEVFYNNLGNLAISISEPVFYKDEFAGIVRWMISIDTLSKRFIQSIKVAEKGCIHLLDSGGILLSHPKAGHIGKHLITLKKESFPDYDWSELESNVGRMTNGEEGAATFYSACLVEKKSEITKKIIVYTPAYAGNKLWSVFTKVEYSEIAGPINRHVKNTFGLAGLVILLFGAGGIVLYRTQKKKSKLETEIKYLDEIAKSAEALKVSEEKLAGIISSVTDHMSMMDEEHNIIWANNVAKELFGLDIVGKKCYNVYHGRDKICEPCIVRKCFQDGKVHSYEPKVITADGDQMVFWCTASVAAWHKDGLPKMVVEVSRDITERKLTEEALKKAKEELEKQNIELKKIDKIKDSLIRDVTHELKTPVAKHSMQIEILEEILQKHNLTDKAKNVLRVMETSIKRQENVIRNILDLSRLEAGGRKYKKEKVHINKILKDVIKDYHHSIDMYGIETKMDMEAVTIKSDGEMLSHVFSNLINNAIKYRNEDVKAKINILCKKEENEVIIKIVDNGIGFIKGEKEKAFDRFYQVSPSAEGSGVGLTISKMIVESLGGKISLESDEKGRGTTVIVQLPL